MEDRIELLGYYFPLYLSDDGKYLDHHHSLLVGCFDNKLYASAYLHLHLLYMSFIYVQILRAAKRNNDEFVPRYEKLRKKFKNGIESPEIPYDFSAIPEKPVLQLLELVGFNTDQIEDFEELVDKRNDSMHANGRTYFAEPEEFEETAEKYIEQMERVVTKQIPTLQEIYSENASKCEKEPNLNINLDEIKKRFSNSRDFLSPYELVILAGDKTDRVSQFIREEYGELLQPLLNS